MADTITTSPIAAAELETLRTLADRYLVELMPHAPVIRDPNRRRGYIEDHFPVDDPEVELRWAVLGNDRIGFARVSLWRNHDGAGATINDFFIDAAWRRQGHGRRFAELLVSELRERGVHRVDLNARSDNPASLAFWQAVGFSIAGYSLRQYLVDPD